MKCSRGSLSAIMVGLAVLVLIGFLTSCASVLKPAKQQSYSTPRSTPTPTNPISVDQADLNKDGKLDQSEIQLITQDKPSVITTFMCIGGLVVAVCGLCVILSRSKIPHQPRTRSVKADMGTFVSSEDQIIVENKQNLDDDEMWCHAEQDFAADPSGSNVGKRKG